MLQISLINIYFKYLWLRHSQHGSAQKIIEGLLINANIGVILISFNKSFIDNYIYFK